MPLIIKDEYPEKLFRKDGKRLDGREINELRPIKMEVGVIKNADGSAYLEWGNNKIIAAVYGPREVHPHHLAKPDRGILRVFYRMATFSVFDRKRPAPGRREKEISMIIADCIEPLLFLELYPGTSFEVFIEVMDADGGTRCASTTVAALALADAGVPMKSLVSAVAVGKIDGKIIVDLSGIEDKAGDADLPIAITWYNEEISLLQFDGNMDLEEMNKFLDLAYEALKNIHQIQLDTLKSKYLKLQEETSNPNHKNDNKGE
ncbi:MAG: exosome complex exonuclease Rrp41 [Candidatus Lokiarchaeota archaeon]|nr:exosome complex exonuclease Rrp41 [Candidatus Lokiarchaeota archaeon]MCK4479157.1 exosome complex exonuclease Rrp41 [Candidatus Lokiarchaeota archaeon]